MATYRTVYLSFWTDAKVDDEFTPEDKYFYLYLLTNPHTNICGCYEISMKQMVRETGYNEDTIKRLLNRMEREHHVILYDQQTKEVLILNWGKYNWCNSPKTRAGAEKVAAFIKSPQFRELVLTAVRDTLSIVYPYPMDTSVTVLNIENNNIITSLEEDNNTTTNTSLSKTDKDFEIFWKAYPKKKNKETARKAFKKLKGVKLDTLLTAIEQQKRSQDWLKDGGQFIPYPASWLNAGGWENEETETNVPAGLEKYSGLAKLMEDNEK